MGPGTRRRARPTRQHPALCRGGAVPVPPPFGMGRMMARARATEPAASLFPRVAARRKGYQPAAVDGFLAAARESFERGSDDLDAAGIRSASFPLESGGYEILSVDRALARLEDAFADRER